MVLLVFVSLGLSAQSPRIDSLLQRIADCQQQKQGEFYDVGLFPSQRIHLKRKNYRKEDNNIFFTGLVVWTLRSQRGNLISGNQTLVDSICVRAVRNYPRYRNRQGGITYNFWQTQPSLHFPNDPSLSKKKKYMLPDDLDDTSVLYLSENQGDSLNHQLKHEMALHANRSKKTIHNTRRKYKHLIAYSTWFGKHMPIDFDLCVQTNALRFVMDKRLEWDEHDIETIHLIRDMVLANEHLDRPSFVSPHYQQSSVILYHLARLVAAHTKQHGLAEIKEKLIQDLKTQGQRVQHPMERLLLHTSLLRFGIQPDFAVEVQEKDFDDFYFFVANMTSTLPNPLKGWFAKSKRFNFYYQSKAYYWGLVWENEMLQKK